MTDPIHAMPNNSANSASIITNSIPNNSPTTPLQDVPHEEGRLSEVRNSSQQNSTTSASSPHVPVDCSVNIEINRTSI